MLLLVGFIIVIVGTLAGFMIAGGQPLVLLHISEFVTIGGITLGVVVVSSPAALLKSVVAKVMGAIKGKSGKKEDYLDLLKLLYETFSVGRRGGLIALEEHVLEPEKSPIFSKYPSFLAVHGRVAFLCDSLKPIIDGRVKPDQLEELMHMEISSKEEEADGPIHVLQLIGDSLPGIGIVAAVLGIINTMSAIAEGPEKVGEHVSAALTGTFLGILGAYGFINPLTSRIKINNAKDLQYYHALLKGITAFAKGTAPLMAVEIARRCLDHEVQPKADELEATLKAIPINAGK